MPRLAQEEEINGNQEEKDKEPGHHKKIQRTEISWGTQNPLTGGTETIILQEVAEMQK